MKVYTNICPWYIQLQAAAGTNFSIKAIISLLGIALFHALDSAKAAALPAYRVSSGAGNTGCFSGKGKASGWKTFTQVDEKEVLRGL